MSRVASPKHRKTSAHRMDLSDLKHLVRDERVWCLRGKVFAPDGGAHWRVETKGGARRCLVEVQTMPGGHDLTCKLATVAGGPGTGLWFIPKVGTVVRVEVSDGALDDYPAIVAVEDSGGLPERAGPERVVLVSEVPVEITAPTVTLGPDPAQVMPTPIFGFVHGQGIDPFTKTPYSALNATSQFVFGKKQ